jgi:hypothetical protein
MNDKLTIPDTEAHAGDPLTNGVTKKDTTAAANLPLPVALRNEDISEEDFEALCRIAEDTAAPANRLKRVPRNILSGGPVS